MHNPVRDDQVFLDDFRVPVDENTPIYFRSDGDVHPGHCRKRCAVDQKRRVGHEPFDDVRIHQTAQLGGGETAVRAEGSEEGGVIRGEDGDGRGGVEGGV